MNATPDTINIPLSLNSYYAERYFSKLERIDKSKLFCVAYEKAYQIDDEIDTTYRFMTYNSFEEFNELTKDEKKPNKRWRELILENNPVVECYDLDAKAGSKMFDLYKNNTEDYVIDEFKNYRQRFMEMYYPAFEAKETFAISTACTKDKFSVHIAVRNGYYFENMSKLKIFMKQFELFLENTSIEIDMSIYKKNQQIRMLNNLKFDKNNTLVKSRLSRDMNDKDFLFGYVKEGDKLFNVKEPEKVSVENYEKPNLIFLENNDVTDYKEMTQLLNLVNSDCDETKWSTVAQYIYNNYNGSDEGLDTFIKWSEKDDYIDFDEDKCNILWRSKTVKDSYGDGINQLKALAIIDSPKEYEELYPRVSFLRKNDSCPDDVGAKDIVDDCTHNNLAKIYSEKCNGEIFYTNGYGWIIYDLKLKTWSWNNNEKALKYPISCFFSDIVKNYAKDVFDTTKTTNKHEEKEFQERIIKIMKVKQKVGNSSFIGGIIEQLQSILTKDNKFVDIFDSKPNLLAFSDGKLIDLNNGGKVRDIVKEDYIMTTTGYPYPKRNSVFIDKMNDIINSLSDDPEQIKSIKSSLSLPFWGENKNELFIQYTGSGGNGKGLLDTGISKVLGNYYTSMNSNQLTSYEKESGRANGELAGCRFSRLVMCTEPEDINGLGSKTTIKSSTIKKWTGRDPIRTRFMYKDTITFTPRFILMLQLNELLNLSTCDNAMKRRLRVVELPFKFVKNNGQPLEDNEKYQNETLKQLISTDDYRDAFFYILLDTWLETNGIFYESNQVKLTTNEFFESQNPLKEWFENNYEIDRECQILVKDMWKKYNDSKEYIGEKVFSKHLKEICKTRKGTDNKSFAFCKIKIVSVDSSEIEDNEIVRLLPRNMPPL